MLLRTKLSKKCVQYSLLFFFSHDLSLIEMRCPADTIICITPFLPTCFYSLCLFVLFFQSSSHHCYNSIQSFHTDEQPHQFTLCTPSFNSSFFFPSLSSPPLFHPFFHAFFFICNHQKWSFKNSTWISLYFIKKRYIKNQTVFSADMCCSGLHVERHACPMNLLSPKTSYLNRFFNFFYYGGKKEVDCH